MALTRLSNQSLTSISSLPAAISTGSLVLIKTVSFSSVSSVDFIDGTDSVVLDSTYDNYKAVGYGISFAAQKGLVCRFRVSGSFVTSGYETQSASLSGTNTSFAISGGNTNSGFMRMGWQRFTGTTSGFTQNFVMDFYNLPSTSADKHAICHMVNNGNSTNDATFQTSSGTLDSDSARTNAVTGLRFGCNDFTTNISGKISLYGVKT
jgi:hypothetical protein